MSKSIIMSNMNLLKKKIKTLEETIGIYILVRFG